MRGSIGAVVGLWALALTCAVEAQGVKPEKELPGPPPFPEVSEDPAALAIAENETYCTDGATSVEPGLVRQADVDGDGLNDLLIDYMGLVCDGMRPYCGTGGCSQEIWLADRDGPYRLLLADQIIQIELPAPGRVRLTRDGGWCGLSGAEICVEDYAVEDGTLVPGP